MKKGSLIIMVSIMLLVIGCSNEPTVETITSSEQPKQIETSTPNVSEVQDFTKDCSKVVIPINVERDTSLDKEKGLLTVHWYDNSKGKNMGVVFRYSEQNCSESAKEITQHVLEIEKSLAKEGTEANSSCETAPKTLNWNDKEYVLITENTSQEPVMKYGFLKCSDGKFIVAKDDDNNSYTVRGAGNPTNNKDLIIIGKWGRALYSPMKEEATKEGNEQHEIPSTYTSQEKHNKIVYTLEKVEVKLVDWRYEQIPLTFQSVNNEQKIQEVSRIIEDAEIVKEQSVTTGKIIIFSKQDDNEHIYGAYETNETLYELGVVGGLSSQMDDELLSIKELKLFNKSLIRIKGVFGLNAPVQNYFSIEDGKIMPFLRVETGHVTELDLDGDGTIEIVSSHGTPIKTYIYKREDEKFHISDLNEALGATSVHLNVENQFEAFFNNTDQIKLFEYISGVLKLLK